MSDETRQSDSCRRAGCGRGRTRHSVFCEEHHREQLERAGSGVELRPEDMLRLVLGPLWLNGVRVGVAVLAGLLLDVGPAIACVLVVALASAVAGWRWSWRLVWQPELGFPVAFVPGPRFVVPVAVWAMLIMGLALACAAGVAGGAG